MAKTLLFLLLLVPCVLFAQIGIGIKAGVNFANVTNASSINNSNRSGFMAGVFLTPPFKGILSYRTELVFSRQGYYFSTSTNTGKVNLDYLLLPQLMGINITKLLQLQFGFQVAFLLNAKADSTSTISGIPGPYSNVMNYYNKFDYGFALGLEVHPIAGLLVGGRYNISLNKLYKSAETGQQPSFSVADAKNNVVQLFAGYIFGNSTKKNKTQAPNL
ncbi:MAG TPA: porin family protein [Flavisolibacter sp.]|nr:porin family protein [Flavisolibacter sp.]